MIMQHSKNYTAKATATAKMYTVQTTKQIFGFQIFSNYDTVKHTNTHI